MLEPADLMVSVKAERLGRHGRSRYADRLDTRITEELSHEGMARDVVRHVQDARKEAGLEMEDRIILYLGTESEKLQRPSTPIAITSPPRR